MKKIVLLCLLSSFLLTSYGQVNLDSLRTVWLDESQADTSRLKAINEISNAYQNQPDSALHFRELQYDLAQVSANKKWKGKALMGIGIIYKNQGNNTQALEYFTQSLKIKEEIEDKQGISNVLTHIGIVYATQGDYAQAIEYYTKSMKISEENGYKLGLSDALSNIGLIYMRQGDNTNAIDYYTKSMKVKEEIGDKIGLWITLNNVASIYKIQGDYSQALEYMNRGIKISEEIGDKKGLSNSLGNSGRIYQSQGDYVKALEYYGRSMKISEEIGDMRTLSATLNNIGNVYSIQSDYEQAIEHYNKSLKIDEEIGDKRMILGVLSNIGMIYKHQGDNTQSLDYLTQSLRIAEELGIKDGTSGIITNIGSIYHDQGDYAKALEYYTKSLKLDEEIGNKEHLPNTLTNIGKVYHNQGNYAKALEYSSRSLVMAQEIGNLKRISGAAQNLYDSYKATGQSGQALKMYELYISSRDSLESEENQKATIRFEFEQKALRDSLAQVEQSLQQELAFQEQLHQKDQTRNILLALGLIALILAVAFFARNRYVQRTNAQLKAAKERAEQSEAVKEQFLANMSHEIRTPMHAISGMIKILERNDHPKAQEVFLDAMHKSSDNLLVLLNDILDLSKVEAGKLEVENIPMQPEEVLTTVEQILRYKAAEKGLQLHTTYAPELPTTLMGDPTRLNQILTNLAGNAIKFTEKGSVNISVSKKNDFVLYEVRDTGIGIPEDKLLSIFDAFGQAEGSTTRRFGGTGLGLSISRQLVELMGGNIWAESEEGKGSSFFVSLPLVAVEGEVADKQNLSEEQIMILGAALSSKRILLAEDNAFNQMIAADDLAYYAQGIQVDIVENGALALEKAQTGLYDLILMDVQMPEMDGVEASLKIREWEQANGKSPIPIIAMTASLLKSEVNLCLEAGMDNYVPKPYEAEELVGTMYEEIMPNYPQKTKYA